MAPYSKKAQWLSALTFSLVCSSSAMAQLNAHDTLAAARATLTEFNVDAPETTDVIASLGAALEREPSGLDGREARFVRGVAAADLILIARQRRDGYLLARIAEAYGSSPEALVTAVQADLAMLAMGAYSETAEDAAAAIDDGAELELPSSDTSHTRRQAAFFARIVEALVSEDDAGDVLAPLVTDPCAEETDPCPAIYRHYGATGRRTIAAMTCVFGVVTALRRAAQLGDPFSAALAREVLVDTVVLQSMTIAPRDWAPMVRSAQVSQRAGRVAAEALIVVGPDRVSVGWMPSIRWDDNGQPSVTARGAPLLADAAQASFSIPRELRPFVRPIDGLAEHLSRALAGAEQIAIAVEPGVEAHMLSRVLHSVEAARLPLTTLVAVADDGVLSGVPFRVVHEGTPDHGNLVGVSVRLGGFSVRVPMGSSVTLPRVRRSDVWRFDLAALDRATTRRADRPVVLRYMGTAPADLVLRAALVVAPSNRPLDLLVP